MKKVTLLFMALMLVGFISKAQTTLFEDDFESFTAGDYVAENSDDWDTWTSSPGGSEDATISTDYNHTTSGANSMKVIANNDMVFYCGAKTSGIYDVNFWYYIPSGQGGYYNIQHEFGATWAFSVSFNDGGSAELSYNNSATEAFTFTQDAWILIENHIDIDADEITLTVEGTEVATWTWSTEEGGSGSNNKLDCVNFYGYPDVTPPYYVDDVEYIQLSGNTPAEIELSATSFTVDGTGNETLTISNTGQESMAFDALVVYPEPVTKNITTKDPIEIKHFDANDPMGSALGWGGTDPVDAKAVALFKYDNNNSTGTNLKDYIGKYLTHVLIYVSDLPSGPCDLLVYEGRDGYHYGPYDEPNVYTQEFTPSGASSQSYLELSTPIYISGRDLFIGWSFTQNPSEHCATMESDGTPTDDANWTNTGVAWGEITNTDFGDFGIIGFLNGDLTTQWLTLDATEGTVAGGGSDDITLQIDPTGLADGMYEADVVIKAYDEDEAYVEIPVTMNLTSGIIENEAVAISTYPNPAYDFLNVNSDVTIDYIKVYNAAGQIVKNENIDNKSTKLDISSLQSGLYLVEINIAGKSVTQKLNIK